MEEVILVDNEDNQVGIMEKSLAHSKGLLHRAFSILIFNSRNELLLQKRSANKYHSPNLWTNACCSHPRPGETIDKAASRRLMEEMGLQCPLVITGNFIYNVKFNEHLFEHEYDYVLKGYTDALPVINLEEVGDFRYVDSKTLKAEIRQAPQNFTFWFHEIIKRGFLV